MTAQFDRRGATRAAAAASSRRAVLGLAAGSTLGLLGAAVRHQRAAACPDDRAGRAAREVERMQTRTLLLLRHAEAEQDAAGGDRERTLTERGERDAAAVGDLIADLTGCPDAIVASDAVRARQTTEIVAEHAGFEGSPEFESRIYEAEVETLLDVVRDLPDAAQCVLLIGHAPGLNELTASLSEAEAEVDLPPAGLVHLALPAERWDEVEEGSGELCDLVPTPDS
jgi:phosphohistidine phosphatase